MGSFERQVIGIIGAPGAWTNHIGRSLIRCGTQLLWPDQVLLEGHQSLYDRNCENPEAARIHDIILGDCGKSRYSDSFPEFFDVPFPGPEQFLLKFLPDKPVAIVDSFICLVWDIWRPYITDVVIVNVEEDVTRHFLTKWIDGNMTEAECHAVFGLYLSQLRKVEDSFVGRRSHLYSVSNDIMKDSRCDELASSIIQAMDGSHVR